MKRGFTLIEMMLALSIGAIMLTAVVGLLSSVWMLARDSANELQGALHSRSIREHLFYNLLDGHGRPLGFGLSSATNIVFSGPTGFTAHFDNALTNDWCWSVDARDATDSFRYSLDPDKSNESDYRNNRPLQYLYLKKEFGKKAKAGYVAYYDRLVVPVSGCQPTKDDLDECFVR